MDPIFNPEVISAALDRLPNLYSRTAQLGIFNAGGGVPIRHVTVIRRDNQVTLLDPVSPQGPRQELNREQAEGVSFDIPTYKCGDVLTPSDIQGITAFQSGPLQLEQQALALNRRLLKTRLPHEQTFEFHRIQALKGIITKPDGTPMYDLFNAFGVTKKTVAFDLDNPNADIIGAVEELEDHIAENLRGDVSTGVHVLVGKSFSAKLRRHPKYEKYLTGHAAALSQLAASRVDATNPNAQRSIKISNTTFESYHGVGRNSAGQNVKFIDDTLGHAFPMGTLNTFFEHDAPAERLGELNQVPTSEISISTKELDHGKGIDIDAESCKLCLCGQPEVLVEVTEAAPV